jgi:hypothetical protein
MNCPFGAIRLAPISNWLNIFYYVEAGATPVLVHNANPCGPDRAAAGHVYRGGRYKNLKDIDPATGKLKTTNVPGTEINHMPAYSSLEDRGMPYGEGPAIQMDYVDHRAAYSTGSYRMSKAYRGLQDDLIGQGGGLTRPCRWISTISGVDSAINTMARSRKWLRICRTISGTKS